MSSRKSVVIALLLAVVFGAAVFATPALAAKPTTAAACKQCHQPADNVVRGNLFGVSEGFKSIQVSVGSLIWVIKYGDDLKLQGADKLTALPKEKEIAVTFTGGEKTPYATLLSVKQPAKVAPEKLITADEVSKLVELGPQKGNFLLVDSRPLARFNDGHIPHAVSLPNDKFDSLKDKVLPQDKGKLIVFYCAGPT